ncbi:EF-P beta-lysylation protein EpmB [Allochromatium vinosum]|uniref:L-lysine 2,3-aminomutase n=1 Tax=Allochromatium vinosum (strain ATCC 17899 / DSM 180 / NBRC 103801 / NCIMB 10441 / D) TaxID=572477 RepID=D3RU25_ALLVD|nr:EF-P beta-lysylation protein EpmB [Allochromatium vinosum]ADC62684.1 lysine 2,3-aminomutase YodO family protein [Allochromatium vinosum DSM 180]
MLPRRTGACQSETWRRDRVTAFTQVDELLAFLELDRTRIPDLDAEPESWGLRVPRTFVERMRRGDPDDPLLRQVLPLTAERQQVAGYVTDPVGDACAERAPGLLVKYAGRALLMVTGACAIHCRYCFRRHFPYQDLGPSQARLERALDEIARDPSLTEVVLSGGDPLMLDDDRLDALIRDLECITHLQRLRLHSRVPVVSPSRLTARLAASLTRGRFASTLVIHANHPRELDEVVRSALLDWRAAGVTLLNQSVLLRGVNDRIEILAELSERLFACGVLPYYLHGLDPVAGSAHFEVDDAEARRLLDGVRARLPGYLVPRLVREIPGDHSKRPLE